MFTIKQRPARPAPFVEHLTEAGELADRIRRAGLRHLEPMTARWDAATREFVFSDGEREVRLG